MSRQDESRILSTDERPREPTARPDVELTDVLRLKHSVCRPVRQIVEPALEDSACGTHLVEASPDEHSDPIGVCSQVFVSNSVPPEGWLTLRIRQPRILPTLSLPAGA